jgi:hypothetical protein
MHTLTVQTRFTFGDRVRFEAPGQECSDVGMVVAITINRDGKIDYVIKLDQVGGAGALQPGVPESDVTLLGK